MKQFTAVKKVKAKPMTRQEYNDLRGWDLPGDEFDFGSGIYLMQKGKRVMRAGWNGKGMFVYIVPAASYPAQRNAKGVLVGDYPNDMVPYSAYIALKTASGEVVPWTISQSDALATDWCLA